MKIKKYLLYLLIFVVAGAIGVSIFYTLRDKDDADIISASQADSENDLEFSGDNNDEAVPDENNGSSEDIIEEDIKDIENYYTSNSSEFKNYGFICPEGWTLEESADGGRIVLTNTGTYLSSAETIMIIVEKVDSFKSADEPEGIVEEYILLSEEDPIGGEALMKENIKIDQFNAEITGYTYKSGFSKKSDKDNSDDDQKTEDETYADEIDMLTYLSDDDHIYIMKYMGSGIDIGSAQDTFTDFLSTFSFESDITQTREEDGSSTTNILILGVDSGMGREWGRNSARSDINMIFHINLETHEAAIVTIPRDLWVPIEGHNDGKINGAYAMGGPELAVDTFENFSGLDIDNYIITDFDGFIPLIDFLGGITVEVNEDLADGFSGCYLSKGVHHLNGEQALALSRNRHRSGDGSTPGGAWAREREAAKIIKALYEQKTTLEKIIALPAFGNFLLKYTWTDLDFIDILKLLSVLGNIDPNDISIRGVPSYSQMIGKASAVVHYEEETRQLFEEISSQ
jgi:LCP family protein required for cell wall assembly